ncbi:MAG: anaerobic glycerol-3-phosphate dehydrogenase subunit A [Chloroflexi bacterium]|nr:anaerobic glycerol-3-phosphate dehydrogenase subunit A [Chloroflexota bacterium]
MRQFETEVLVIGGGSTGGGVARDAAMRGFRTLLIEKGDLSYGTTGRYHGLLHSGGRYVIKDPPSARECIAENRILRRISPDAIEDTSGFFVVTPADDPAYSDQFYRGCLDCDIPVTEITLREMLQREPRLNPGISRAFEVPDAAIDAFKAVSALLRSARQHGAEVWPYHRLINLHISQGSLQSATVENLHTGEKIQILCNFVINAAGAWCGQVAAMAGCSVTIAMGKGTMIAMNHRLVNTVINRCKPPDDGDILVPIRTVSVIGTTDYRVPDPDRYPIERWEIELLMAEGEHLVPGFKAARALRAWAGVRPLYQSEATPVATRDITRSYVLLDHETRDGCIRNFLTITGGKFTTYRLMAQVTVDMMCQKLNTDRPCTTHLEVLPDSEEHRYYHVTRRLRDFEASGGNDALLCECEFVTATKLESALHRLRTANLDDLRRHLRLAMGPCQGGFCIFRAAARMHESLGFDVAQTNRSLVQFLEERWKGEQPILWGDQLKQARLDDWIYRNVFNVSALPQDEGPPAAAERANQPISEWGASEVP